MEHYSYKRTDIHCYIQMKLFATLSIIQASSVNVSQERHMWDSIHGLRIGVSFQAALGEDALKKQARQKEEDRRQAAENAVVDPNLVPLGTRAPPKQPETPVLEPIPEIEWWDSAILGNPETYDGDETLTGYLNEAKITIYVEHPVPLDPPAEDAPPPPMPLPLTQKERKKLRTQR